MAEEALVDHDVVAMPHVSNSSDSIIDVAMRHAERGSDRVPGSVVVDLRVVEDTEDITIEFDVFEPSSPALDLERLVAIPLEPIVEPPVEERPVDSRPALIPSRIGGLATASAPLRAVKRAFDLLIASTLVVLLSPVFAVVAIAVKLTSPGPVFYRSQRVGRNGTEFGFLKFRTMRTGADKEKAALASLNEKRGPVFKMKNDPRITPFGAFLRRTSLDELPQLLHVISGRMSLVGPRPPLPAEVAKYSAREAQRLLVRPGLTCIWQVSGRSDIEFDQWVDMDLEYVRTWSPWLDLKLLVLTVPAVLSGRGAY